MNNEYESRRMTWLIQIMVQTNLFWKTRKLVFGKKNVSMPICQHNKKIAAKTATN